MGCGRFGVCRRRLCVVLGKSLRVLCVCLQIVEQIGFFFRERRTKREHGSRVAQGKDDEKVAEHHRHQKSCNTQEGATKSRGPRDVRQVEIGEGASG